MKSIYSICLLFLSLGCLAQFKDTFLQKSNFKILIEQGDIYQYSKTSKRKTKRHKNQEISIFAGNLIPPNTIYKVSKGAYLLLIHIPSSNLLEFMQEGNIDIDSLEKHYIPKEKTWEKKYSPYIFTNLINASKIDFAQNNQRYILGDALPVTRGCRCSQTSVSIYLPEEEYNKGYGIRLFNEKTIILRLYPTWRHALEKKDSITYLINTYDFYGKKYYSEKIRVSSKEISSAIKVDLSKTFSKLKHEHMSLILDMSIAEFKEPVKERASISIDAIEDKTKYLKNISSFNQEANNVLDHIFLASFYEENGLIMDAFRHLEMLMAQRPQVHVFKILHQDFVIRYKMNPIQDGTIHQSPYYFQVKIPTQKHHLKYKYQSIQNPKF